MILLDVQSLKLDDYSMANGDVDDDPFSASTFEVITSSVVSLLYT